MPCLINKSIEIVRVPLLCEEENDQKSIAIRIDENKIHEILSSAFTKVSITLVEKMKDLEDLVKRKPDLVFSGVKYFCFEDEPKDGSKSVWLTDYLELYNLAYIGSNRVALNNEYNKSHAKEVITSAGIETAPFFTTQPGEHKSVNDIPIDFPVFIKPVIGGDSRGIDGSSYSENYESFESKVLKIHQTQGVRSLVEPFLKGNEYSVGILEDCSTGELTGMPVEIIPPKNTDGHYILDFKSKKSDKEKVVSVVHQKIRDKLVNLALKAFSVLGGKGFGRIDIKMDAAGVPHFLEANLLPGLGKGYFYRACKLNLKMSYEQMIITLASNAIKDT